MNLLPNFEIETISQKLFKTNYTLFLSKEISPAVIPVVFPMRKQSKIIKKKCRRS